METIKNDLKNNQFKQLYFFLGEEVFLSDFYINAIKGKIVQMEEFNYFKLDTEKLEFLQDAVQSSPMMSEKKLVVLRGLDFSKEIKDSDVSFIEELIEDIPFYTHIIFACREISKKTSKIYKLLSEKCTLCEFKKQGSVEIIRWIANVVKRNEMEITKDAAELMTKYAGFDMNTLKNEIEKCCAYSKAEGIITENTIKEVVTRNIESKTFDLLDAVMDMQKEKALMIFAELEKDKEEPVLINGALSKTIMGVLEYKLLKTEGQSVSAISSKMGLKPYTQKKYARYCDKMSEKFLQRMLSRCSEFDISYKTGIINGYTGLTLLICEMMER